MVSRTLAFLLAGSVYASCKGGAHDCKAAHSQGSSIEELLMVQRVASRLDRNAKSELADMNGGLNSSVSVNSQDHAFVVSIADCSCNLLELECLPTPECMEKFQSASSSRIAGGVTLRRLMKMDITWDTSRSEVLQFPIGKGLQYTTMATWKDWVRGLAIPARWSADKLAFGSYPDANKYPYCKENHLIGGACIWGAWNETEDLGDLEAEALSTDAGEAGESQIDEMQAFRDTSASSTSLQSSIQQGRSHVADDFLKSFANLMRIKFHREKSMQSLYTELVTTIGQGGGSARRLKVAMHIRRADSCDGGIEKSASRIDTPAMTTPHRTCYEAAVYAEALQRVYEKYRAPLEVYLSTDSDSEILDELTKPGLLSKPALLELKDKGTATRMRSMFDIRQTTLSSIMRTVESRHPHVYEASSWRILNYSRALFKYDGVIDVAPDDSKSFLVEAAIQDLWHLSHGEIFVGHLSSRFGKVAYLLAVARQNSPIAYISPDGHNLCCEVDEVCSAATKQMANMADCLLFAHEQVPGCSPDYWESGCNNRVHVTW